MATNSSGSSGGLLTRWARFSTQRPKQIVLGWVIMVAILGWFDGRIRWRFC